VDERRMLGAMFVRLISVARYEIVVKEVEFSDDETELCAQCLVACGWCG
jgi:hypothetical protein